LFKSNLRPIAARLAHPSSFRLHPSTVILSP
jgi:hypothetical protein